MAQTHAHRGNGDAAKLLNETKKAFTDAAQTAKEAAEELTGKVIHDAKAQSKLLQGQLTTYVKKKPMAAVGGALAIGFILSWLLRR